MGICSCMSTKWLAIHCLQIALEFKSVDFCEGNKTGEPGAEKNPRSKDNNQQQTQQIQPKYDAGSGNRTQATLAGGERSHHCAIQAPQGLRKKQTLPIL